MSVTPNSQRMQGLAMLLVGMALMQAVVEPAFNTLFAVDTQSAIVTELWTGPFSKVSTLFLQFICRAWVFSSVESKKPYVCCVHARIVWCD